MSNSERHCIILGFFNRSSIGRSCSFLVRWPGCFGGALVDGCEPSGSADLSSLLAVGQADVFSYPSLPVWSLSKGQGLEVRVSSPMPVAVICTFQESLEFYVVLA